MLAVLFAGDNDFLLIDEPTNHLDHEARQIVKKYLADKKGFILVSHDRDLLDACIDHVLVLNRKSIEIQSGNFSSWWENKMRKDTFLQMENEKHLRQIGQLKRAASGNSARSVNWMKACFVHSFASLIWTGYNLRKIWKISQRDKRRRC